MYFYILFCELVKNNSASNRWNGGKMSWLSFNLYLCSLKKVLCVVMEKLEFRECMFQMFC